MAHRLQARASTLPPPRRAAFHPSPPHHPAVFFSNVTSCWATYRCTARRCRAGVALGRQDADDRWTNARLPHFTPHLPCPHLTSPSTQHGGHGRYHLSYTVSTPSPPTTRISQQYLQTPSGPTCLVISARMTAASVWRTLWFTASATRTDAWFSQACSDYHRGTLTARHLPFMGRDIMLTARHSTSSSCNCAHAQWNIPMRQFQRD